MKLRDKVNISIMLLGLVGVAVSVYLWSSTIQGKVGFCPTGCNAILKSEYGKLLGIPVASWGVAYYSAIIGLAFQKTQIKHKLLDNMLAFVIGVGMVFTLYLRYLEFVKIGEICAWCWVSVAVLVLITVVFGYWYREEYMLKKEDEK
jgi:uncharacterized membrane protein